MLIIYSDCYILITNMMMIMFLRVSLNDPMTPPLSAYHWPNNIQRTSALTCGPVFVGAQRHILHVRLWLVAIFLFLKYASSAESAQQKRKKEIQMRHFVILHQVCFLHSITFVMIFWWFHRINQTGKIAVKSVLSLRLMGDFYQYLYITVLQHKTMYHYE